MVVDEGGDRKLIQALKSLTNLEGRRLIYILAGYKNQDAVREKIIAQTQLYLPGSDIYFCDADIFVLTHVTSVRECKKAMEAMAAENTVLSTELYDLALQMNAALAMLEKKLNYIRSLEEPTIKQPVKEQADTQQASKRQNILGQSVHKTASDIAAQRALRSEPRLMIIEDDIFSRRLVENVLQKQYHLAGLDSATDALATYADIAPDLLFLDINLPDVSGHELLEKIIAIDPKAYVVMLSGSADRDNIMQAMSKGAKGFVAKPFSREKLFQYIERCPTIHKEIA